ncbi:hypothetical protein ABFB50_07235 [Dehalococcoides sp. THU3]|jgi:hypothetical protein|uniref:hypothetical protein n=1 Tax=Dehalococcoides TaxID=61434 RepID=UPI0002B7607D|nr:MULTISPECIES: hypothetical protein [Dehalococcoides]AGG08464.1 hypothetical protein btf_1399 [Dehalococcoides mccartyi BTF08]AQX75153.1 hypothetical protein B1776_06355 [Dehalococcoides mccartyi]KSV17866.1 hypothetical protein CY91_03900 [Dehalococcoides mccartyi]QYY57582.1 hypothetical protein CWV2_000798 [Dehalococcoides mccartyi]BAQ35246.1 hypothetical protein UCH007_12880 [Dehalococcoides sp. UCH007]
MKDDMRETLEKAREMMRARNILAVFQTAYVMALEGTTRASAGEISAREKKEFDMDITPSNVGQAFCAIGIKSVVSHGKVRYVLNVSELERICKAAEAECEEMADRLEDSLETYEDLNTRVLTLLDRLKEVFDLTDEEERLEMKLRGFEEE